MAKIAQVKVAEWHHLFDCLSDDQALNLGDQVVIETEWGQEIGKVVVLREIPQPAVDKNSDVIIKLVRKVTTEDLESLADCQRLEAEALRYCRQAVEKLGLAMKIIDAHYSFDGLRIVFPFIADGRVDFRQLVKDLTHHLQKSIRMQQIGIRDEAKITGDVGSCGRRLCCATHLHQLNSITSEMADNQQVAHRGAERLSGLCGRLRCCLAFEEDLYREAAKDLPAIGSKIKTPKGMGKVIGWHTLRRSVDVLLDGGEKNIIEIPIKE
ncbi:MAG: regulatory iron-sulfur-containing complex subunit RicT [Patescibacteria group bacterium]|jgi:cell fate regulator YaaT (PSP1 superfamily)|nr:regulatory iron-sulfur-containing complex subunit RicT [Patescibacteria group bacterium]